VEPLLGVVEALRVGQDDLIPFNVATMGLRRGFSMILYLAGLQSINPDLYEAGQIDGIDNAWQRFRYISGPLLVPTMALLIITNTIGSELLAACRSFR
jgi:multiple sugar transport system permease protein